MILSYSGDPTKCSNHWNAETIKDKTKINEAKCNNIYSNFSSTNTPPQNLTLNNNEIISVDRIKLLGVTLTSDLRWKENTAEIIKKVNKRYYQLCRLKQFGVKQEERLTTWKVLIQPITEYAAPLWHTSLLECDKLRLETSRKRDLG